MPRRVLFFAALSAAVILGVWGCQDYNFNPVGSCIVQPGETQVKLADVTTADVLFVVDDSGSTDSKQQGLAQSFSSFIGSLATSQADRASRGLEPYDFHLAVTTSSVFQATPNGASFTLATTYPNPLPTTVCTPGVAVAGAPYPDGNFVAGTLPGNTSPNAKVLHFTKDLTWANCSTGGACTQACITGGGTCTPGCTTNPATGVTTCTDSRITSLIQQFVGTNVSGTWSGGNVEVGSCGSGEEQHLQGGRLAMQKALAGQQPGVTGLDWPHLGAKLIIVWVGDEDDCSSDPANPVVMASFQPGNDSCVADKNLALAQQKEYRIADFASYFGGLVAPAGPSPAQPYSSLSAAFIVGSVRCEASGATVAYTPADWNLPPVCPGGSTPTYPPNCISSATSPPNFGSFAGGVRFFQMADAFEGQGRQVIEGTVCDIINADGTCCNPAGFGPVLSAIADLVTAPTSLKLPSVPASTDITLLRVAKADGTTVKVCTQRTTPGPVASPSTAEGWWFVDCADTRSVPDVAASPTRCLFINHAAAASPTNSCEANPGETYSAEYLGQLPPGGCTNASPTSTPSASCAQGLPTADGGPSDPNAWWCYGPTGGTGTCVCR